MTSLWTSRQCPGFDGAARRGRSGIRIYWPAWMRSRRRGLSATLEAWILSRTPRAFSQSSLLASLFVPALAPGALNPLTAAGCAPRARQETRSHQQKSHLAHKRP